MYFLHYYQMLFLVLLGSFTVYGEPAKPVPDWITQKQYAALAPHPRLYVSQEQLERERELHDLSGHNAYLAVADELLDKSRGGDGVGVNYGIVGL